MYTSVCKWSSDRPPSAEGEHTEDSFDLDVTKQMWQTRQLTVSMTSQTGNLYFCPWKKKVTLSSSPENWQNTEAALKSRPLHGGLWSATHSCRDHCFTSLTLPLLRSNNIPSVYFHGLHLSEEALSVLPWEQVRRSEQTFTAGQHKACLPGSSWGIGKGWNHLKRWLLVSTVERCSKCSISPEAAWESAVNTPWQLIQG